MLYSNSCFDKKMLEVKPKILARKSVVQRITDKILGFVGTYINGMGT
jgi:hypothetical protein